MKKTIDLIKERKRQRSLPLERLDSSHVALVIEGGGMRGVAAGGMVSGLEKLDLLACFDSVHGSSAGAAAGAFFVSGQAQFGTRMFYEDLCGSEFIDPKRALRFGEIMNTSFLVDHVMSEIKPINFEKLTTSKVPLHIVATDIDTGEAVIKKSHSNYDSYRSFLKASITIPYIAGKPKIIDGRRVMDGGLVQQIALSSAFDAGATHVLVLQTRRRDEQNRPQVTWKTRLQSLFLQLLYGGRLGSIYRQRNQLINESVELLRRGFGPNGEQIAEISLDDSINYIHRLTKEPEPLRKAANVMSETVLSTFSDI